MVSPAGLMESSIVDHAAAGGAGLAGVADLAARLAVERRLIARERHPAAGPGAVDQRAVHRPAATTVPVPSTPLPS